MSPSIHKQILTQSFSNIPLCSNIQKSTFPHQPKAGGPPFLSRTGNVLHSSRESAFVCLLFNKVEEVQHSIVIPSDSHSGINYPPFANANGFETTDCLECLQILDILIYGRRVCFRIWSSRTENVLHAPPLCSFRILTFFTKEYLALPLQPHEPWLTPSRIP